MLDLADALTKGPSHTRIRMKHNPASSDALDALSSAQKGKNRWGGEAWSFATGCIWLTSAS